MTKPMTSMIGALAKKRIDRGNRTNPRAVLTHRASPETLFLILQHVLRELSVALNNKFRPVPEDYTAALILIIFFFFFFLA